MRDIIMLFVLVIGIASFIKSKKGQNKVIKYIGIILIIVSLVSILPNCMMGFVEGVKEGWADGYNDSIEK